MRSVFSTSPLICIVVRPRITPLSCGAPGYACSLYTLHTKPEQSKPPGVCTRRSVCVFSLVPPQTYGKPMKETAVLRIRRCHGVSSGSSKPRAASRTACVCQSSKPRICAAEKAASARVASSPGRSSSKSWRAGWFVRRPRSRAAASLPKRAGGASPAARAARVNAVAASWSPRALTNVESSPAIVTGADGAVAVSASPPVSPKTRSARAPCVSGASGLNLVASPPMRPREVTSLI